MSKCRAFVYSGIEDFGIAPVEAIASGAPVIGLAKGGLLDTVQCLKTSSKKDIPTGILFDNQTTSNIVDAINWFEDKKIWRNFNAKDMNIYSQKFNEKNFNLKINNYIQEKWDKFKKRK